MPYIIDRILNEVCLDERVSDGIFKLDEELHMEALRDYFIKKGITKEDSIRITNRMLEGRFPERQAYNKDGILVTFPTPQHKQKAIQRGTHFDKNPAPQNNTPPKEPVKSDSPEKKVPVDVDKPIEKSNDNEKGSDGNGSDNNIFPKEPEANDNSLKIEPPNGDNKVNSSPPPSPTNAPTAPRTPERIAAEKDVIHQILATDNSNLTSIDPKINEVLRHQLFELYEVANKWGFNEAIKVLKSYIDR